MSGRSIFMFPGFFFLILLICFILLYLLNPTVRAFVSGHCCDGRVHRNCRFVESVVSSFTLPSHRVMESDVGMNLHSFDVGGYLLFLIYFFLFINCKFYCWKKWYVMYVIVDSQIT